MKNTLLQYCLPLYLYFKYYPKCIIIHFKLKCITECIATYGESTKRTNYENLSLIFGLEEQAI